MIRAAVFELSQIDGSLRYYKHSKTLLKVHKRERL